MAFLTPFFGWEGSPKIDKTKKKTVGTLILTSLLEDLVGVEPYKGRSQLEDFSRAG